MTSTHGEPPRPARVLQPCGSCARVLDVTGLAIGTLVRCRCQAPTAVAPAAAFQLRAYTCGRCGGAFQEGAATCPYCEASLVLADRRLAGVCGRCSARLDSAARFCPACGAGVREQSVRPFASSGACPRCRAALQTRGVNDLEVVECSSCGGIWLTPEQFGDLSLRAEDSGAMRRALLAAHPPVAPVRDGHVAYVQCVSCSELMLRKNLGPGSGIVLDVCKDHGVWFDHEELLRALDFAQRGGLDKVRAAERARKEKERAARMEAAGLSHMDAREPRGFDAPDSIEDLVFAGLEKLVRGLLKARR